MPDFIAVIMAAGKGTRMKSALPKVMHCMAGKPLIDHILDKIKKLDIKQTFTIIGHGREIIEQHIKERSKVVIQEKQFGTGHALMQAVPLVEEDCDVLVLSGDQPLLQINTLRSLMETHRNSGASATVLTAVLDNPSGYGRILKKDNRFIGIVEEKDSSPEQKEIKEINTGTYCFKASFLKYALSRITPQNAQGEYYLTDVFDILLASGEKIETYCTDDWTEALGINNRVQLAQAEEIFYRQIREYWMKEGVTIVNPGSVFIDPDVELSRDVTIHPFTIIKGKTRIEEGAVIGPRTTLDSCICKKGCSVDSSVAREAVIGENCTVGPFAYLRPGTVLEKDVKVGDFVEIKNSKIGPGSKIPHLSYVGDSLMGSNVNIGAGTITCNYDGKNKHQTIIEDNVFVGSNTNFVAPVKVGAEAVIGAGSTITKDVPEKALAVERSQQRIIENWQSVKNK